MWRRVDAERHPQDRFVHRQPFERKRVLGIDEGVADLDLGKACDQEEVTGRDLVTLGSSEPVEAHQGRQLALDRVAVRRLFARRSDQVEYEQGAHAVVAEALPHLGYEQHPDAGRLGLAIVRHVATNHGGEVLVSSQEGEGSTFVLRLPADLVVAADGVAEFEYAVEKKPFRHRALFGEAGDLCIEPFQRFDRNVPAELVVVDHKEAKPGD